MSIGDQPGPVDVAISAAGTSSTIKGTFTFQTDNFKSPDLGLTNIGLSQLTYKGALAGVAINHGVFTLDAEYNFIGGGKAYCADCTIGGQDGLKGGFVAVYTIQGMAATYTGAVVFVDGFGDLKGISGGGTIEGNCVGGICTSEGSLGHYDYTYTLPPPASPG